MNEFEIIRVTDDKIDYMLEESFQDFLFESFLKNPKYSAYNIKFTNLKFISKFKNNFMNKTYTLYKNSKKIKDDSLYIDLDVIFTPNYINEFNEYMDQRIYFTGNVFHCNWDYFYFIKNLKDYFKKLKTIDDEMKDNICRGIDKMFEYKERYSTMLLPGYLLKDYFDFLKKIKYKKFIKKIDAGYTTLEELLFSIFMRYKLTQGQEFYNLHISGYNFLQTRKNIIFYHNARESVQNLKSFAYHNLHKKKYKKEFKKNLKILLKYSSKYQNLLVLNKK